MLLKQGCNEILRPDMLTALYNTHMWSQVMSNGWGLDLPCILSYAFIGFLSWSLPMLLSHGKLYEYSSPRNAI